ncbi:MAG TPA: hypothetical protein VK939_03255 [Longimicrobiales bacterium]|nr:hypothetical protein [Longimicrobiales bacterium]
MSATTSPSPQLPEHLLGGTARRLPALGLDARALARSTPADALPVLRAARAHGIEFVLIGGPASELHVAAARGRGPESFFLASGTTERSCDRALRALDQTLARLDAPQVDLWQLLDLQRFDQLDAVCRRRGALEALVRAREDGRVRFIGLGGDTDPGVLLEAMRRFDFDTLMLALRPGERRFAAYRDLVLPQARRRGMGLIATPGASGVPALACARYAFSYLLSLRTDLVVLPCTTVAEVELQVHAAAEARPFSRAELARIDAVLTGE